MIARTAAGAMALVLLLAAPEAWAAGRSLELVPRLELLLVLIVFFALLIAPLNALLRPREEQQPLNRLVHDPHRTAQTLETPGHDVR